MERTIKSYLEWKGTYAPRASVNYKIWLNRFVEVCGDKLLSAYDVSDIIKYRHWIETRYNPYTVQFATVVIKNFFNFCRLQNQECLSTSLIKLPRITAKSHRAITEDEFNKLIAVIPTNEFKLLRDSLVVRLLWDTGMRVSELSDLDVSQIHETKHSTIIKTKKSGKPRIIVWSDETHILLMKYMPIRLELHKINNASALFVGWHRNRGWSMRYTPRSIQRMIKYYADKADLKVKISPHAFRHGWAHLRRDHNAPLAFIQRGLGHSNPISTFVYEQYNDKEFVNNAMAYLRAA